MQEKEVKTLSPLTLAFVGDAVYEILVRQRLVERGGSMPAHQLHQKAIGYVSAKAQSSAVEQLVEILTEEEIAVFKRGRNASSTTSPKNTSIAEYRRATGVECLLGYLHLAGHLERLEEVFNRIWQAIEMGRQQAERPQNEAVVLAGER